MLNIWTTRTYSRENRVYPFSNTIRVLCKPNCVCYVCSTANKQIRGHLLACWRSERTDNVIVSKMLFTIRFSNVTIMRGVVVRKPKDSLCARFSPKESPTLRGTCNLIHSHPFHRFIQVVRERCYCLIVRVLAKLTGHSRAYMCSSPPLPR